MASSANLPNELPATESVQPGIKTLPSENVQPDIHAEQPEYVLSDIHAPQPDKSYFEWARQSGQPWPERPKVLDLTRTRKLKYLHHIVLPELFVPIQEVFYGRDKTLKFSRALSTLISLKLNEAIEKILESRKGRRMRYHMKKARTMYRKLTKYRKPSMGPIQLPFSGKRPIRAANIQFPECILELADLTWSISDRRIRIAASAAERMIAKAILWIDHQHWVLDSFKYLSCAPKEKLRRNRRDSHKGINILLQHITNGRWIWITSIKPAPRITYMLGPKNQEPQEADQMRLHINIGTTQTLHDARMAFFSLRPKDHRAALQQFCSQKVVNIQTLQGMFDFLFLAKCLYDSKNAAIIENVGKRLPAQMAKYWNIQSKSPKELKALIKSKTEPDLRRLLGIFKRPPSPRRAKSDPELLLMANRRLLFEREHPTCPYEKCDANPCEFLEGHKAAATRKVAAWAIAKRAFVVYAKEKACHQISCHPCFIEKTPLTSCIFHKSELLNSKKRETECVRCWMLPILDAHRKNREQEKLDRESPFVEPKVLVETIFWDPAHQSCEAPDGWCCHTAQPCRKNCYQEHRTCPGNCKVIRNFNEHARYINENNEEFLVTKIVFRPDPRLRRRFIPIENPSGSSTASSSEGSKSGGSKEGSRKSSKERIDEVRGFWKKIRSWTKFRSSRGEDLACFQTNLKMHSIAVH